MVIAELLMNTNPEGAKGRLAVIKKLVNFRKRSLRKAVEFEERAANASDLEEQSFYRQEAAKCRKHADGVVQSLRFVTQFASDEKVVATAIAELL